MAIQKFIAHHFVYKGKEQRRTQQHARKNQCVKHAAGLGGNQKRHAEHTRQRNQPQRKAEPGCPGGKFRRGKTHLAHSRKQERCAVVQRHGQGHGEKGSHIMGAQQLLSGKGQAVVNIHGPAVLHIGRLAQAHHRGSGHPQKRHKVYRSPGEQLAQPEYAAHGIGGIKLIIRKCAKQILQGHTHKANAEDQPGQRKVFAHQAAKKSPKTAFIAGCFCSHSPQPPFLR